MNALKDKTNFIELVRGKGLMNAMVIKPGFHQTAWDVCLAMKEEGVLAKPTHGNIIRFAPPLVITEDQMNDACDRIEQAILKFI
jgi:ornithine--oxo-acid transaminase